MFHISTKRYIVPKGEPKCDIKTVSTCSNGDKDSESVANGSNEAAENGSTEPPVKKQRLSNKEYKKLKKGQNKVSREMRYAGRFFASHFQFVNDFVILIFYSYLSRLDHVHLLYENSIICV